METSIRHSAVCLVVIGAWVLLPALSLARVNTLTTGLATSFDYTERRYDEIEDDPDTEVDETELLTEDEGDYRRFILTPLLQFTSTSEQDSFELRLAPDLQYDFLDSDTDWAGTIDLSFARFISQSWQLGIENSLMRGDYYQTPEDATLEAEAEAEEPSLAPTDPELSPDIGRTRYWRNSLSLFSEHEYSEESLARIGFGYIVLRNDDDDLTEIEDYDRYELSLVNEHRFSPRWATTIDMRVIRGIFDDPEPIVSVVPDEEVPPGEEGVAVSEDELSSDLWEYRGSLTLDNYSIERNPLSLSYRYIGTRYDEELRRDLDIHQMRATWRRDFSSRLYTSVGLGPTYLDLEGQDNEWDVNGLAEINYLLERGSFNFAVEKGFDTADFGGTTDRGLVDYWEARLTMSYQLLQSLTMTASLAYLYDDRTEPAAAIATTDGLSEGEIDEVVEYHIDRYRAGFGLTYDFWQHYSAGVDYAYLTQDSDRLLDSYDEHRVLLTVSWQMDVMRW